MELTKTHRLVWTDNKIVVSNPFENYEGSKTYVGTGCYFFESNSLSEIEEKIESENLIYQSEQE